MFPGDFLYQIVFSSTSYYPSIFIRVLTFSQIFWASFDCLFQALFLLSLKTYAHYENLHKHEVQYQWRVPRRGLKTKHSAICFEILK